MAATLIYRYYVNYRHGTETAVSQEAKDAYNAKYVDASQVEGYAVEAMQWANAYGIVNGTSETTLTPTDIATRAQVTKLFVGFVKKFAPPTIV